MVFSSGTFLFLFLPVVIFVYYNPIVKGRAFRNVFLLLASILFYAWGEPLYVVLMLSSIVMNWLFGLLLLTKLPDRLVVTLAVLFNLAAFFVFKYYDFAVTNCAGLFGFSPKILGLELPIGISFYTFQALSYVIDVKRDHSLAQKNLMNVGLYISFFPQLIAGPIVRYETVAREINDRQENFPEFADGLRRFLWGLSKKVIIANNLAVVADRAFDGGELTTGLAWLGVIAYTLQIYFDFSGYSDMAIGLGRMFGFHFNENFNYPYAAVSVTDFWRRWHISLSSWFRDYVYIPLGGNRVKPLRHIFNLFVVWLLTGTWHGAEWTFILWGLVYFVLLMLEKYTPLGKLPRPVGRIYTLFAVMLCWVLFRAASLSDAVTYLRAMFTSSVPLWDDTATVLLTNNASYFIIGALVSFPIFPMLTKSRLAEKKWAKYVGAAVQLVIFLLTVGFILRSSYDPFIYFNF